MRLPLQSSWSARATWMAAALAVAAACGCRDMLDQDRHDVPPRRPTTMPTPAATGALGQVPPPPGVMPAPKPFVAVSQYAPREMAQPSPLLVEHSAIDSPYPLSAYGSQPTHEVDDFRLNPELSGLGLQKRLGPPAALAGIEERWYVYRLTGGRELWLNFAGGDGPLRFADEVRGAENGYVRTRLYPTR